VILDTDTISYYLRGSEPVKTKMLLHQHELASTTINYAELLFGLKKRDKKRYLPTVELIFEHISVHPFDKHAAAIFSELKARGQRSGTIVADMDLMIASIAIAQGETLITNNLRHFSMVEGLEVESWI